MAAAPKAWTTSWVRTRPFRLSDGAKRTPDRDAKVAPMTHAQRRTCTGLSPVMATREGSSTTPRMAEPEPDEAEEVVQRRRGDQGDQDDDDLIPTHVDAQHPDGRRGQVRAGREW